MPLCGHCQAPHAQVYQGRDTGTRVLACSPECAKRCAMQRVGREHTGITMRDELERRNETTRKLVAQMNHIEHKVRLSAVIGRVLALLVATEENPMGMTNHTELVTELDGIINDLKVHYDLWKPRPEKKLIFVATKQEIGGEIAHVRYMAPLQALYRALLELEQSALVRDKDKYDNAARDVNDKMWAIWRAIGKPEA